MTGRSGQSVVAYLPHAAVATALVAVAPGWIALVYGGGSIGASLAAMAASVVLTRVGTELWQRHPGSADVVFGDLMLWAFVKRLCARRTITKRVQRLALGNAPESGVQLRPDQQLRMLKRLAVSLEASDPYTHGHSQRVARHAMMIAKTLNMPRRQQEKIRLAGLLHDIGKLHIPSEVLNKPGRLTDDEFDTIKEHPALGAEMVESLGDPALTAMVKHHHERFDGTGYPTRLAAEEIPLGARILSVADTFDALTSRRAYRDAQKHRIAIEVLKKEAGTQLDADVVRAFLKYYSGRRGIGRWSFLSGGAGQLTPLFARVEHIGMASLANAAVAGTTAIALATTPLAASNPRHDAPHGKVAAGASSGATDVAADPDAALGGGSSALGDGSQGTGRDASGEGPGEEYSGSFVSGGASTIEQGLAPKAEIENGNNGDEAQSGEPSSGGGSASDKGSASEQAATPDLGSPAGDSTSSDKGSESATVPEPGGSTGAENGSGAAGDSGNGSGSASGSGDGNASGSANSSGAGSAESSGPASDAGDAGSGSSGSGGGSGGSGGGGSGGSGGGSSGGGSGGGGGGSSGGGGTPDIEVPAIDVPDIAVPEVGGGGGIPGPKP